MHKDFISLIEESINLELKVADLYLLFYNLSPEDAAFWWKLVMEENNHASLIRTAKDYFEPETNFPHDLLANNLQDLKDTNGKLESLIKYCESNSPSREEAFNMALNLENSSAELHYQDFMNKEESSKIDHIFKLLNEADKDHAMRISSYMETNGIRLQS